MTGRRPAVPAPGTTPGAGPQPVEVRLVGANTAVRQLVAALTRAADCGPAAYRPARNGGTRAYLVVIVPAEEVQP